MDWRERIDPELRPLVRVGGPVLGDLRTDELAAMYQQRRAVALSPDLPGIDSVDVHAGDIGLRIYSPADAADGALPCIYAIHGGGFIVGSNRMDATVLAEWALQLRCVCVSVDYR